MNSSLARLVAETGTHLGVVKFNLEAGIKTVDVPPQPTDAIANMVATATEGRTTYMMARIVSHAAWHFGTLLLAALPPIRPMLLSSSDVLRILFPLKLTC